MNEYIFNSSLIDMMKRFPLINSESEAESVAKCPKAIYKSCPSASGTYIDFDYIHLKSAMLGQFCIIAPKHDKLSEGDKWQLSNIELKQCQHDFPR